MGHRVARFPQRHTFTRDGRRLTLAERLALAPPYTSPPSGKLPPRRPKPTPAALIPRVEPKLSGQAQARREAKRAEAARTFAGVAPGATLPKLGLRQRIMARGRLSLAYAKALRTTAWLRGRRVGTVPIIRDVLADVEQLAGKYRAKEHRI